MIFISSGDGTIQAIQSFIAEGGHFARPPQLCILPHGTTNMTAADLGFQRRSIAEQAAFIANPDPQQITERRAIRVLDAADGRVRQGMFLGTGAVAQATRQCQTSFNDQGVRGNLAAFAIMAQAAAKALFLPANPDDARRIDRPADISCDIDGQHLCDGPQLTVMATTLHRLVLNAKPFWGGENGAIRATSFSYPLPRLLLRWILPAIMGGEERRPPPGANSISGAAGIIKTMEEFVIDGEFFRPPASGLVRFETGQNFSYITA